MNEYKWENQDEWIEYISINLERAIKLKNERRIYKEKMEQRIKKIYKIKCQLKK
jgi:hypothetical protein